MRTALLAVAFLALLMGGCASHSPRTSHPDARARGAEQASRDLTKGRPRLMLAGTDMIYAPGVSERDARRTQLPRKALPSGCTEPTAFWWIAYAEAYNSAVLRGLPR